MQPWERKQRDQLQPGGSAPFPEQWVDNVREDGNLQGSHSDGVENPKTGQAGGLP